MAPQRANEETALEKETQPTHTPEEISKRLDKTRLEIGEQLCAKEGHHFIPWSKGEALCTKCGFSITNTKPQDRTVTRWRD